MSPGQILEQIKLIAAGHPRLIRWWTIWAVPVMLVVCLFLSIFLAFRQHAAFQTNLYDLGSYTQLVWNISRGAGFTTSLGPTNYLTNHFSLLLLLIAPFMSSWPDARTLMVVESVALIVTIVPPYLILRKRYPVLAPLLVLAFVISPLLHQSVTAEFHGIMLAAPFLAWAFYAMYLRRTWLLFGMLGLALFAREDMGFYAASFGLFMLICRKGQRLIGLALTVFGLLWVVVIIEWVMPSFGHAYHHFNAFASVGGKSLSEMISTAIHDPMRLISAVFTPSKLKALVRLIAPLAGLPIIAMGYSLLWLPVAFIYLISSASASGLLNSWRIAPFLPLLWGSIAVLLVRLRPRWAYSGMALLMISTIIGFLTLSPFPGGGKFNASLYQVNAHTRIGEQVVASVSPAVSVAAPNGLAAHLGVRPNIRLFPWYSQNNAPQVVVLDEQGTNQYPLSIEEAKAAVLNFQLDPAIDIIREQDGYFVFGLSAEANKPVQPISATWASTLQLYGFDLAHATQDGPFEFIEESVESGSRLRVELYWTALRPMPDHYSISVRLLAADGRLIVQEDGWPARGALPTPLWEIGRSIRDVHYLDLPASALPEQLSLQVIVYAADTLQPLEPVEGYVLSTLQTTPPD